jgi:hypothetical protein
MFCNLRKPSPLGGCLVLLTYTSWVANGRNVIAVPAASHTTVQISLGHMRKRSEDHGLTLLFAS